MDPTVLDRGVRYLTENLKSPESLSSWQANQQAFAVYTLAEAGPKSRTGPARFTRREKLSLFAEAYLALALDKIGDEAAAARVRRCWTISPGRPSPAPPRRTGKRTSSTTGT